MCFQRGGVIGGRDEAEPRSAEARGKSPSAWAIAAFQRQGIHVVRRNIENLIKLPQRFGETTKEKIGKRVLGEQVNIARVEPLGLVEE